MSTPAFAALVLLSVAGTAVAAAAGPRVLYVAPNGSDAWSGRLAAPNKAASDGPFATLERARDAVRALKAGGPAGPFTVLVRGGTYRLSRPFVLRPEDSGTERATIVYAAYPGEKPVLSGARILGGWKPGPEGLWTAGIPEAKEVSGRYRQLFVNGERRLRARLPREGLFPMAGTAAPNWDDPLNKKALRYRPEDIRKGWARPGTEVVVLQYWMAAHLPLTAIDEETHTLTCAGGSWRPLMWSKGYLVENLREGLDVPGRWCLDYANGVLAYRPLPGEEMGGSEAAIPVLERLVRFEGDPTAGRLVEHITLKGLTFSHTEWRLGPEGFAAPQGDLPLPAAIEAEGARRCAFVECTIAHTGAWGMSLGRGCRENRVERCAFAGVGAGGLRVGEPENRPDDREEACGTLVTDCTFTGGAALALGSPAIWIGQSSGNRISHNEVSGGWQWAVSVGWNWSYMPPNRARDNVVEENHLHHVGTGPLGSHSVVYALGVSPSTVIRRNRIHDSGGYAIALDASASGILVEQNICYRMQQGGFHLNWYCLGNIVQDNVFALGKEAQLTRYGDAPPGDDTNCNILQRNLFYWREGKLYNEEKWPNFRMVNDYNLYWDAAGRPVRFLTFTFDEWKAHGLDRNSVIADPLFANPDQGDFSLRPDSPARKLGFRPADLSRVGPRR